EATAYHPMDGDGRGITASGMKAGYGVVAVDPNVIPMGTRVFVPGYGEAIAADTGGAIIGNRIDLCMETYDECYQYGRRNVEVYVLD
ncbi:MAG: 3D domain-containing protein, partial [Negativicoccus succinicivorans]|nr:3D domain-containing protein [Negativicoccus succinicivorans]